MKNQETEKTAMENHERFVQSLEKHGDFSKVSQDLGWSEDLVRNYAYRYLVALQLTPEESGSATEDVHEWTTEESILLESLLAKNISLINGTQSGNENENDATGSSYPWYELIALQLPGKSGKDVLQRYNEKYRN